MLYHLWALRIAYLILWDSVLGLSLQLLLDLKGTRNVYREHVVKLLKTCSYFLL
jgi:hypothetical protein